MIGRHFRDARLNLIVEGTSEMQKLIIIDLVGVDLHVSNSDTMVRETGNAKYRPHPLLRKMVRAGLLGRKSGRGFYVYDR